MHCTTLLRGEWEGAGAGAGAGSVGGAGVHKAVKELRRNKTKQKTERERGNKLQNYMRCAHISGSCHETVKSTGSA